MCVGVDVHMRLLMAEPRCISVCDAPVISNVLRVIVWKHPRLDQILIAKDLIVCCCINSLYYVGTLMAGNHCLKTLVRMRQNESETAHTYMEIPH